MKVTDLMTSLKSPFWEHFECSHGTPEQLQISMIFKIHDKTDLEVFFYDAIFHHVHAQTWLMIVKLPMDVKGIVLTQIGLKYLCTQMKSVTHFDDCNILALASGPFVMRFFRFCY